MNGYAVWLVWIACFGLLGIASLTRLLIWRKSLSLIIVGAFVPYLLVSMAGVGLGVYQLFTMSPARLAAQVEGALLVEGVAGACLVVILAAREIAVWSAWRLASRGARLLTQERYAQALAVYDRLRRRSANRAPALAGKGSALLGLGRFDEAVSSVDEALRLSPQDARIWLIKIQALLVFRRDSEALAATERGLALAPRNGALWVTHGVALYRLGRLAEARETSERALSLLGTKAPPSWRAMALTTIALALTAEGRPEEALTQAEQALALNSQTPGRYLAKALALERLGRVMEMRAATEQGLSRVEHYLSAYPARPDLVRLKEDLMHLLGRKQEIATEAHDA
jgi:tetratricopeptide (TPR) repeat protein